MRQWSDRLDETAMVEDFPVPANHSIDILPGLDVLLDRVSPASRAVLLLHYVEDLSIEETAAILDISVGTAKSRLAYGLACLREFTHWKG
jgi:DNA-directed RNA polymerase specialized sigma24 family protein